MRYETFIGLETVVSNAVENQGIRTVVIYEVEY